MTILPFSEKCSIVFPNFETTIENKKHFLSTMKMESKNK